MEARHLISNTVSTFKMPVNIAYSVYSQKPNKSTRQKYGVELKVLSHVQKYYKL